MAEIVERKKPGLVLEYYEASELIFLLNRERESLVKQKNVFDRPPVDDDQRKWEEARGFDRKKVVDATELHISRNDQLLAVLKKYQDLII